MPVVTSEQFGIAAERHYQRLVAERRAVIRRFLDANPSVRASIEGFLNKRLEGLLGEAIQVAAWERSDVVEVEVRVEELASELTSTYRQTDRLKKIARNFPGAIDLLLTDAGFQVSAGVLRYRRGVSSTPPFPAEGTSPAAPPESSPAPREEIPSPEVEGPVSAVAPSGEAPLLPPVGRSADADRTSAAHEGNGSEGPLPDGPMALG